MANLSKLSSLGGLLVAGAGLGLYLGSSAISEINPAYYSTPSSGSTFHADLVPNPGDRDSTQPLPELATVATDSGATCVSCSLTPDGHASADYPAADRYDPYRPLAPDVVLAQAEEYIAQNLSAREAGDIERYAHFRVSDDEEAPALALSVEPESGDRTAGQQREEEAAPGI